jgi:hypothetical protein
MPAPTNQTAATALDMASLPYALTLADVDLATPTPQCDVWWKYTPAASGTFGFWAYEAASGNYTPAVTVWTGTPPGVVSYLTIFALNKPLQIPVTGGTTYYFRVRNDLGTNPSASTSVAISGVIGPDYNAAIGSILVNDDSNGYPAALLSAVDGSALNFLAGFPAGESGDTLSGGQLLAYNFATSDCKFYTVSSGVLSAPTTVALDAEAIRTCLGEDQWYVSLQTNPAGLRTVDATGAIGATTWTLGHNSTFGIAAANDGSLCYYSEAISGSAIHTWNLGTNTAGADFAAADGALYVRDILVLSDDTVVASYVSVGGGTVTVKRRNAAGTLLNTYGSYTTDIPSGTQPRLAYGTTGSFWLWTHGISADAGLSTFRQIRASDGVVLATITSTEYETGVYNRTETATPSARFGNSFSCPFLVLTAALNGTGGPPPSPPTPEPGSYATDVLIPRRLRRATHLSTEQLWNFYHAFQLDLETGVGLTTGQGSDPQIMLRYSDDGGHTWSSELWVSAGALGNYAHRAIWRRLGRSRDRIFEIIYSEPTKVALVNAYLDVSGGTS